MDSDARDVFQAIILDHDQRPRNYGAIPDATESAEGQNPLCGDRYRVYVRMDGDTVEAVTFEGHGCAVSRASASIMTTLVAGLDRVRATELLDRSVRFITSVAAVDVGPLGDMVALEGVRRIPTRQRCALVAWIAFGEALQRAGVRTET